MAFLRFLRGGISDRKRSNKGPKRVILERRFSLGGLCGAQVRVFDRSRIGLWKTIREGSCSCLD